MRIEPQEESACALINALIKGVSIEHDHEILNWSSSCMRTNVVHRGVSINTTMGKRDLFLCNDGGASARARNYTLGIPTPDGALFIACEKILQYSMIYAMYFRRSSSSSPKDCLCSAVWLTLEATTAEGLCGV